MLGQSWNYLSSSLKFVSLALLRSRAIVYTKKSSLVAIDRNKCPRPSLDMPAAKLASSLPGTRTSSLSINLAPSHPVLP